MAKPAKPAKPDKASAKPASVPEMVRRQAATEATLKKYRGTAHDWKAGRTCVHLAKFQLRQMGHHLKTIPPVRSELAARKALRDRGFKDVAELLDTLLPRIPPARMLLGDLAVAESGDGLGAIVVCAGPFKFMGWHDHAPGMVVLDLTMNEIKGAWRL